LKKLNELAQQPVQKPCKTKQISNNEYSWTQVLHE